MKASERINLASEDPIKQLRNDDLRGHARYAARHQMGGKCTALCIGHAGMHVYANPSHHAQQRDQIQLYPCHQPGQTA